MLRLVFVFLALNSENAIAKPDLKPSSATEKRKTVIIVNENVDLTLENANKYFIENNMTQFDIEEGRFGANMYHSDGMLTSMGSLVRTGVCTHTYDQVLKVKSYDYNVGARIFHLIFHQLEFIGKNQTVSIRIKNNSLHIRFSVLSTEDRCNIILQDLAFNRLDGIEFSSNQAEYNSNMVEMYFKETVIPTINSYMKFNTIPILQNFIINSCVRNINIEEGNIFELFLQSFSD